MRLIKAFQLVAVLTHLTLGGGLVAQQTSPPPPQAAPAKTGKAAIVGVVLDSLHRQYLRGADVIIEGTDANTVTDSTGRFRIEGLVPGTYRVGIFHPLLDTLSITLATKPFRAGPDSTSLAVLAVPSAATIIRGACGARFSDQDNSAVIGHVKEPETLRPVAGAEVSLAWVEIEASKKVGVRRTPHALRDTTDATGAFQICGVPGSMDATLQARKAKAATSEIPVSLEDGDSQLFTRTLLISLTDTVAVTPNPTGSGNATVLGTATFSGSASLSGPSSVSGRVVLDGSQTNSGSRVELVGTDIVVMTDEKGQFMMAKVPSGSRVLLARHLGYAAQTAAVDLSPREPQKVTITLPKFVAMMDPILITARLSASLDRIGFNERKKATSGYFFGPDRIQSMHPAYLTDILRSLPSIRVRGIGRNLRVTSSRGTNSVSSVSCIQYYLDGTPWQSVTPGDINDFVSGSEIVAAEVYQGAQAPPQFRANMGNCTTIVLWTRFRIPEVSEKD